MSSGLLESSERPVAVGRQIVDARALRQTLIELSRVPDAVALCGDLVETAAQRQRDGGHGGAALNGRCACLWADGHWREPMVGQT
jgi:hypothetical protein